MLFNQHGKEADMNNKIKKWQVYALAFVILLAGTLIFFSVRNSNAGTLVYNVKGPIEINGFEYTPGLLSGSGYKPSKISFSDVKVLRLPKKVKDSSGIEKDSFFYSVSCRVNVLDGSKKFQFLFKGTGEQFAKPGESKQNLSNLIKKYGSVRMLDGACYDIDTGKPINNYDLLVAPDFSFATFLVNPSGQAGFRFNSFFQIANGKLVLGIRPLNSNLNTKVFFFENGITYQQYLSAVKNGPVTEVLQKKIGRAPTDKEITNYIIQQLAP